MQEMQNDVLDCVQKVSLKGLLIELLRGMNVQVEGYVGFKIESSLYSAMFEFQVLFE